MSDIIKAIILGVVQGLSEFLPISSSGHLVLAQEILNFHESGLAMEIFVHFGTVVAVLAVFRRDVWGMIRELPGVPGYLMNGLKIEKDEDQFKAMTFFIIIGTIPAAFIGLLFKRPIEALFESPFLVLIALLLTGIILWSSRYTQVKSKFLNWVQAIIIGFAQAFAIIPGISRSGSTIVTSLWLGIDREVSARFSFLLSIPAILGATILQLNDLLASPPSSTQILHLIIATIAAAFSGYLAIIWVLEIIRKQKLEWFGVYCVTVSIIGILLISGV